MKSLSTLLTVACLATIGFTGCTTTAKQCPKKPCPMMTKKCVGDKNCCCSSSSAACPTKKNAPSQQ